MPIAIREVTTKQDLSDPVVFRAFYDEPLPVIYGNFLRGSGGCRWSSLAS